MQVSKEDRELFIRTCEKLGREDFIKVYKIMLTACISEIGIGDRTYCPRVMTDDVEEVCIDCVCNHLDKIIEEGKWWEL